MGRFWSIALGIGMCACFLLGGTSAHAWQLADLDVAFTWKYEWYNQTGHKGFFGRYNVDNGPGTTTNQNFWNGGQFDTNITTSADAGWSYFYMEFNPQFRINPAIKMTGKYRLGTYGDPINSNYHTQDSPGVNNAFSEGQWTMLWVTAQTPWGVLGIGKRPWRWGTGLQYDTDGATTESIVLAVPYGPLDIGIGYYPYRFIGTSSIPAFTALGDPYDLITVTPGISRQYFSRADKSGSPQTDVLAFVTYSNGPLHAGILVNYGTFHIGPEAPLNPLIAHQPVAQDSEFCHGSIFTKYMNGRFFFNAEAAWLYWTDRYSDPTGLFLQNGIPATTRYIEQWRYIMELGSVCGPAKASFLFAVTPGPDRRNGIFIGKQPAAFIWHPTFENFYLANFSVFRSYAYIFSYDYGSGLNAYNLSNDGYIRDASVFGARIDYAVAANLNLFGSFAWAERTSNGYSWGCIGPNAGAGAFPAPVDGNIDFTLNRYPASPNIPDRSLGYEVDAGFNWKLLEKWQIGMVFGYWQPGKWFNYACIDRSVPAWHTGNAGNLFGTRPDRSLNGVIGGEFSSTFEF
ncbi:MAG TPA: hypothetical protein VMC85_14250 [Desulfomonilaceae bacterium]|nr:hypothetical protein [Desulfomonilaceae bacterium]